MKSRQPFKGPPLILFFLFIITLHAAADISSSFRLTQIGDDDGLPNLSVSSIIQDRCGIIWFGTKGGLVRYDGRNFNVLGNDPFNNNSLSHNLIQTMTADENGSIWIGTYMGLNHFDPLSGRFTHHKSLPDKSDSLSNNVVTAIFKDSRKRLWVGTLNGLNLKSDHDSFRRFYPDTGSGPGLPDKVVRTITEDGSGDIWIGTYGGFSKYNEENGSFSTIPLHGKNPGNKPEAVMTSAAEADGIHIWLGLWSGEVIRLNTESLKLETYQIDDSRVYKLQINSDGKIWVGTWGQGLVLLDPESGEYERYTTDSRSGLSSNIIYSLFEDVSGVTWIGTNGGGLNKYVKWHNRFTYFLSDSSESSTLTTGRITELLEDGDQNIWAGIYAGGINVITKDNSIKRYSHTPDAVNSLPDNIVNSMAVAPDGKIWIGTNNGYSLYRKESDDFLTFKNPLNPARPSENIFYKLFFDSSGNFWLGTYNSGLFLKPADGGAFETFQNDPENPNSLSDNLIRDIVEDKYGRIWIATNNGLNRYSPGGTDFKRYIHKDIGTISSNDVRSIAVKDDELWIGTMGGGISIYNIETDSFNYLTKQNGLISNNILHINLDRGNEIWITEQRGISIYNRETGQIKHITKSSGLLSGESSSNTLIGSEPNALCGGVNGITVIPFDWYKAESFTPSLNIVELQINGENFLNPYYPMKKASLALDHYQNNLSIELNSNDYSLPDQNSFKYMLSGFDTDWISAGNRHYLSYTNLPSGKYTFYAKGSGSRDNWSSETLELAINIRPHPLQSIPAISLYIALGLLGILCTVVIVRRRQQMLIRAAAETEKANRELELRVKERTSEFEDARNLAEEASKAKSLFLANMSHELRTPLNGIIGMLSLLYKTNPGPLQKEYIDYSKLSAENLLLLLDDILDYEKLISGKIQLAEDRFEAAEIIEHVKNMFNEKAAAKNINISTTIISAEPVILSGDKRKLTQILTNLVSNAVKYTDSGEIKIIYEETATQTGIRCNITVSDTGPGIPPDKIKTIFNSFEQLDSSYTKAEKGVGLGLAIVDEIVSLMGGLISVNSTQGQGTSVTIEVPLSRASGRQYHQNADADLLSVKGRDIKVLIAEDEAINRLYITKLLSEHDFRQIVCKNGEEAVRAYTESKPDIVLMDIGMPVMNGMEAVERIRAEEENLGRRSSIIMLSAHVYKDDIERAIALGADDFLAKPFSEQDFTALLMKWIKKTD